MADTDTDRSAVDEHGGWPTILTTLVSGQDLDREVARAALSTVLAGAATDAQLAAFIVALRQKGESVEEINGLVDAMLAAAAPLDLPDGVIDIVGTGGAPTRRVAALSVSTMSCFVAAAAGAKVAKHGNVKASATAGAFDTLDALGVTTGLDGAGVRRCVDETGLGFVFAKAFHPAMRFAGPVRTQMGIPTVFNVLGPLSHPGHVRRQLIGVSDPRMQDRVAGVLAAHGSEHAWVVHGDGQLDELALTGPSRIVEVRDGEVVGEQTVDPTSVGLSTASVDELAGGDAAANAAIAGAMFAGEETGPRRDIVALNSGAALLVAGVVDDLGAGVEAALAAITDGGAARTLAAVVEVSAR